MVCCRQKWITIIKQNLQGSNDQTRHMHPILIWAKGFTLKIQWEAYLNYLFSHALSGDTSHPEEQYVLCKHITDRRLRAFCTQKNKMEEINKSSSALKQFLFLISDKENIQCPSPPTSCITSLLWLSVALSGGPCKLTKWKYVTSPTTRYT